MVEVDEDNITPGFIAFLTAFVGGGFVTLGLITGIFFLPLGALFFVIGSLAIVGSPIVWFIMKRGTE